VHGEKRTESQSSCFSFFSSSSFFFYKLGTQRDPPPAKFPHVYRHPHVRRRSCAELHACAQAGLRRAPRLSYMGSRGGLAVSGPSMSIYEATDPGSNPRPSDFSPVDSERSESRDG